MAIMAENGVVSSERKFETNDLDRSSNGNHVINGEKVVSKDQNLSLKTLDRNGVSVNHVKNNVVEANCEENGVTRVHNDVVEEKSEEKERVKENLTENGTTDVENGKTKKNDFDDVVDNVTDEMAVKKGGEGFKEEIRDLEEGLSKLNPMAKEFIPTSLSKFGSMNGVGYAKNFVMQPNVIGYAGRRVMRLADY